MRVAHIVGELHLLAVIEQALRILLDLRVQRIGHFVAALLRGIARMIAGIGLHQQRIEIEIVEFFRAAAHLIEQIGAADHFFQLAEAERGQNLAHFFRDEAEEVDDLLRRCR